MCGSGTTLRQQKDISVSGRLVNLCQVKGDCRSAYSVNAFECSGFYSKPEKQLVNSNSVNNVSGFKPKLSILPGSDVSGFKPKLSILPGNLVRIIIRMSFIARYIYSYEELFLVTEAPQSNRMTVTRQDTDHKNSSTTTPPLSHDCKALWVYNNTQ